MHLWGVLLARKKSVLNIVKGRLSDVDLVTLAGLDAIDVSYGAGSRVLFAGSILLVGEIEVHGFITSVLLIRLFGVGNLKGRENLGQLQRWLCAHSGEPGIAPSPCAGTGDIIRRGW